jgi:hypothetical protein
VRRSCEESVQKAQAETRQASQGRYHSVGSLLNSSRALDSAVRDGQTACGKDGSRGDWRSGWKKRNERIDKMEEKGTSRSMGWSEFEQEEHLHERAAALFCSEVSSMDWARLTT